MNGGNDYPEDWLDDVPETGDNPEDIVNRKQFDLDAFFASLNDDTIEVEYSVHPRPLHEIIPELQDLRESLQHVGVARDLKPEHMLLVQRVCLALAGWLPFWLLRPTNGVTPAMRGIEVSRNAGFMDRITFFNSDVLEVRAHVFAPRPRGEDWIHDHAKSFCSYVMSGAYTHDLWSLEQGGQHAANLRAFFGSQQTPLLMCAEDRHLEVKALPEERAVSVQVFERVPGVGGGFELKHPTADRDEAQPVLERIFRHQRSAGELLYLHHSALHTVLTVDADSDGAPRLITIVVRAKAHPDEAKKPVLFYVDPRVGRVPNNAEDGVTALHGQEATDVLELFLQHAFPE